MLLLAANPWKPLFDGASLQGWTLEGDANFRVEKGVITVDKGTYSWLRSNESYGDYELKLEFKTAADGNSGIFLRSAATGKPHETGYEIQIFDAHPQFPTGSIVGLQKGQAAKLKPDVWNQYEIRHQGPRLLVKLNGKTVLDLNDTRSAQGHVGLQFNPNKPISFRRIQLRQL
jgi:hypothetical protein